MRPSCHVFLLTFFVFYSDSVMHAISSSQNYLFHITISVLPVLILQTAAICSSWFLVRGFVYPEAGGYTFLRNIGSQKIYTALHPTSRHSSTHPIPAELAPASTRLLLVTLFDLLPWKSVNFYQTTQRHIPEDGKPDLHIVLRFKDMSQEREIAERVFLCGKTLETDRHKRNRSIIKDTKINVFGNVWCI
jgi:hypothetical protein